MSITGFDMAIKLLLVIDNSQDLLVPGAEYRGMMFRGFTYTEPEFRAWVHRVWGTNVDGDLAGLAQVAKLQGWRTLEVLA